MLVLSDLSKKNFIYSDDSHLGWTYAPVYFMNMMNSVFVMIEVLF